MTVSLQTVRLSRVFRSIIADWLTLEERVAVDDGNAAPAIGGCCRTHDYCDANQAMLDALERLGIVWDLDDDGQAALIDAAWSHARRKGFANPV